MTKTNNASAAVANSTKTKGAVSMYKIKSVVSRVSAENAKYREYVATVLVPEGYKLVNNKKVASNELEFVVKCIPSFTNGDLWMASIEDVTRKPNGGYWFNADGEKTQYGMACVANIVDEKNSIMDNLKAEIAALDLMSDLTDEESVTHEVLVEQLGELSRPDFWACELCDKVGTCQDIKKSMKAVPNTLLYDGAKPHETIALGSSVASVVAKIVNAEYPRGTKSNKYAGWNKCSTCKFSEYIKTDTDPDGIDAVTGTITMENGTEYKGAVGTMDPARKQQRDMREKERNIFCTLDERMFYDWDACDRYIWNNYQTMTCSNTSSPVAFADNILVTKDGVLKGTMAYAVDPITTKTEATVIEVQETKDKNPGFLPTPYKAGTFVALHEALKMDGMMAADCIGSVEVCENRKRDDGKYFTYMKVLLLNGNPSLISVDCKEVTKIPEDMLYSLISKLDSHKSCEDAAGAIDSLRKLMPKGFMTAAQLREKSKEASNTRRTYVSLTVEEDFTQEQLDITAPGIYYDINKDTKTRWLVSDFFVLTKEGNRIKGIIKKIKGDLKIQIDAGYLSPKQLETLSSVIFSNFAKKNMENATKTQTKVADTVSAKIAEKMEAAKKAKAEMAEKLAARK